MSKLEKEGCGTVRRGIPKVRNRMAVFNTAKTEWEALCAQEQGGEGIAVLDVWECGGEIISSSVGRKTEEDQSRSIVIALAQSSIVNCPC